MFMHWPNVHGLAVQGGVWQGLRKWRLASLLAQEEHFWNKLSKLGDKSREKYVDFCAVFFEY